MRILMLVLCLAQEPVPGIPAEDARRELAGTALALSDDATFLRRITLDLISEVPESEEVRAFLSDRSKDKREQKAKDLLGSRAFARAWSQNLTSAWLGYP